MKESTNFGCCHSNWHSQWEMSSVILFPFQLHSSSFPFTFSADDTAPPYPFWLKQNKVLGVTKWIIWFVGISSLLVSILLTPMHYLVNSFYYIPPTGDPSLRKRRLHINFTNDKMISDLCISGKTWSHSLHSWECWISMRSLSSFKFCWKLSSTRENAEWGVLQGNFWWSISSILDLNSWSHSSQRYLNSSVWQVSKSLLKSYCFVSRANARPKKNITKHRIQDKMTTQISTQG